MLEKTKLININKSDFHDILQSISLCFVRVIMFIPYFCGRIPKV